MKKALPVLLAAAAHGWTENDHPPKRSKASGESDKHKDLRLKRRKKNRAAKRSRRINRK